MDAQQLEPEKKGSKLIKIVIFLFFVLITSLITGGVVYLWQKDRHDEEQKQLQEEIDELKDQVNSLESSGNDSSNDSSNEGVTQNEQATTNQEPEPTSKEFKYKNFSITYLPDWVLTDMATRADFPLKQRLEPLYGTGKVVALSKNGIELIITIEEGYSTESGGIFLNDEDVNNFTATKDQLLIGDTTFYLAKDHYNASTLVNAHTGPAIWNAVTEYVPSKTTGSGNVFRGYENLIKRNNYSYIFIVTSDNDGVTDSTLQSEMITMLKTIKW